MISSKQFNKEISIIIANAIREDVGEGDHSSLACISNKATGSAHLLVKDDGIIAGVAFAQQVFDFVDPTLVVDVKITDGNPVKQGDVCFIVSGSSQSILKAERLVLNAMQRMSAIATKTNQYVKLLESTNTKILDTRKTTPGIRALEKWAVTIGGGENHRFGLYDMIMLKDNHINFAGGIPQAIKKTKQYLNDKQLNLKIEVEARDLEEVKAILASEPVDRIMLDNFSYENLRIAVNLINSSCETEASGGITKETIRNYAECGVDFISVGALTHQIKSLDMSLKAI